MPDDLPRPDFLAFADSMKRATEQLNQYGESPLGAEELEQAERYARLLAQIQEWASRPDPSSDLEWAQHGYDAHTRAKLEVLKLLMGDMQPMPVGVLEVRAYVRRLLEQP